MTGGLLGAGVADPDARPRPLPCRSAGEGLWTVAGIARSHGSGVRVGPAAGALGETVLGRPVLPEPAP